MTQVTQLTSQVTTPAAWVGEFLDDDEVLAGGARVDPTQFPAEDAVIATVGVAGAAQNATSIPVAALSGPIPSGTLLWFGGAKYAHLTSAAAAGATALAVSALPTALVSGDVATYLGVGKVTILSGTVIGRTYAERDAGTGFGPVSVTGTTVNDDEVYLLLWDVTDANVNADCNLYRHQSLVKENFLPGYATINSGVLAYLRANYQCIRGAD